MKTIALGLAALIAACSLAGTAEARPGKGKAYGHYKNHKAYRHAAPRGHRIAPRHAERRSRRDAAAAGVAGAILGGTLGAVAQPRVFERAAGPYYRYYGAPRRYDQTPIPPPRERYFEEHYYYD